MSSVQTDACLLLQLLDDGLLHEAELLCQRMDFTYRDALAYHLASNASLPSVRQITGHPDFVATVRTQMAAALIRACVADDLDGVAAVLDVARVSAAANSADVGFLLSLGQLASR